ncbi:MAG: PQQ-binding-like beta-propeller repeat protein [Haloferacaceae archaeon]
MRGRRELLASLGVVGAAGCLRLQDAAASTTTSDGTDGASTPESTGARTTTADATGDDAERVTLSERWAADFGVRYVRTDEGHFFFNGLNRAAEAVPGDGILWSENVSYDGSTVNLGADAIAKRGDTALYGFFSERGSVEKPGAHFVAYEDVTGEKRWSFTVPAAEADGFTVLPRGVALLDDVAVVGVDPPRGRFSRVYGVDAETGDQRWRRELRGSLHDVGAYDGRAYLNAQTGVSVVDPATGETTERHRSWRSSPSEIHGDALFGSASADSKVHAYPLADGGVEWSTPEVADATALVVDNSLVVVGTESGDVHAFERATGERRWQTAIDGTAWQIALSARHAWVADRETGLTAYDRGGGRTVHQSTQPLGRSDVGVVSETLLFGMDTARAYRIESA